MKEPRRLNPEESLQISFKETLDLMKPNCIYLHIPNEGKRSWAEGKKMKRMGLVAGAPDWLIVWHSYYAMLRLPTCGFIEMKTTAGKLSLDQLEFQSRCRKIGVPFETAKTVERGIEIMRDWGIKFEREVK